MSTELDRLLIRIDELRKPGRKTGDDCLYTITSPMMTDPNINPCILEQHLARKCLYYNDYKAEKCKDAFDNYKECGKFWGHIKRKRMLKMIKPALPPLEDRERIKTEFFTKTREEFTMQKEFFEKQKKKAREN